MYYWCLLFRHFYFPYILPFYCAMMIKVRKLRQLKCFRISIYFFIIFIICRFTICNDCYIDAQKSNGVCPGCKEPYRLGDFDDDQPDFSSGALPLPAPNKGNGDRRMMSRKKGGDFDHNKWLFNETQGTYGHGTAYWPPEDAYDGDGDGMSGVLEAADKPFKPLSRVIPIPNGVISPYRFVILLA